jgi:GNAT superfamily N-acetyltransferase
MSERRVIRATGRALTLLADIVASTSYLYAATLPPDEYTRVIGGEERIKEQLSVGDYLIGFEEHLPFGFVGAEKVEESCRLIGPFLYREYLGRGYGRFLLEYGIKLARGTGLNPIYQLIHRKADWAVNFFTHWGFEQISDDVEFIRRWHDGLLADKSVPENHLLMALLLDVAGER